MPKDWRICGVTFEGNKGGSYLRFAPTDRDDIVRLEVGHDCVTTVKEQEINIFALAAILTRAHDVGFKKMIEDLYNGGEPPKWAEPY